MLLAVQLLPMAHQYHTDDRSSETETKFYLPAADIPPLLARPLKRLWRSLAYHDHKSSR